MMQQTHADEDSLRNVNMTRTRHRREPLYLLGSARLSSAQHIFADVTNGRKARTRATACGVPPGRRRTRCDKWGRRGGRREREVATAEECDGFEKSRKELTGCVKDVMRMPPIEMLTYTGCSANEPTWRYTYGYHNALYTVYTVQYTSTYLQHCKDETRRDDQ